MYVRLMSNNSGTIELYGFLAPENPAGFLAGLELYRVLSRQELYEVLCWLRTL
jgi:hypothetical protein